MGWRFRKRVKIAPGVNLNISPRGFGVSAGNKYGRVSVSPSGRVTGTQRIPGTGIYNQQTLSAPTATHRSTPAQNVIVIHRRQPFFVRLLYFTLIGWWATLLWWTLALALMLTLIGIPLGLRMMRKTAVISTLA